MLTKAMSAYLAANARPFGEPPAFMIAGYGFWIGFGCRKPFLIL